MKKRFDLVQRLELIKQASAGRKVLHLGCTNWPYTHEALAANMLLHVELERVAKALCRFDYDLSLIHI